jgi:RNA polymerase sigma-70 factor (ECF subfamily)
MPQTDAAAVALARGGDSEAFRALVERHSRAVFRLAQRMTGSPHDAEDVVQETFLRAYKQLGRFESRANFGTWLHRIAVNCSIDLIRSRANRETGHEAEDLEQFGATIERTDAMSTSPERLMLSSEVQDRVQAAMASPAGWSVRRSLRHFEGQSIEEISRALA